ncbi:HpcH/HpaI aldolase/citrate lyase family protein [Saliphagus sp. GCM10025308]
MTLRERFDQQTHVLGSWMVLEDPSIAELIAEYGHDFIVVDMEHSPLDVSGVTEMGRAMDASDGHAEMITRIPWNDHVVIKRVLDMGASGILVPWVNTVEEAEAAVEATRYPPEGIRGVGPLRPAKYGKEFDEYMEDAEDAVVIVQIETEDAVENVEDIVAVDGIDGVFIGPGDLAVSLGTFGSDETRRFDDAVDRIVTAAHEADVAVGTVVGNVDDIDVWLDRGVDFLAAGSDIAYLNSAADRFAQRFQEAVEDT